MVQVSSIDIVPASAIAIILFVLIIVSVLLSMTVFTIIDLDRPRSGLVTLDEANTRIIALRDMFK